MSSTMIDTDKNIFPKVDETYQLQLANLQNLKNTNHKVRLSKIKKIKDYLSDAGNEQRLCDAMFKDFRKPKAEVISTEIIPTLSHITEISKNLKYWMQSNQHSLALTYFGLKAETIFEPKGQTLIIAPWNYPFFLAIYPMLYAISAGCSVILKPSELTPHTSHFIQEMITELFAENEVKVFLGDVPISTYLLEKKWGHIFFTGSPHVGKIVMKAASKTLSSVSLELGGKSPCIIDESAHLEKVVQRLVWGKFVNAGQTCIAPDYVLLHESQAAVFNELIQKYIEDFFGPDPFKSDDFARIITTKHTERITALIEDAIEKDATLVAGGITSISDRYVSPTVLSYVDAESEIMKEEIFGPVLPIVLYKDKQEVIDQINRLEKPLSLYICSNNRRNIEYFTSHTTAGGTLVNEFLLGAAIPNIPFGGVNNSGIGKAFGEHGFREFVNERAVVKRKYFTLKFIYPPYSKKVMRIVNLLKKFS